MNDFQKISIELKVAADKLEQQAPRISLLAANRMLADLKRRVFFQGADSKENQIGEYSTKPMLAGSKTFTKYGSQISGASAKSKVFGSKKKRASRKWVTVGGRRLIVLQGGYKEFRKLVGRKVDKVNLFLTGDLFRSIVTGKTNKGAAVGMNQDKQYAKAKGNEKHFGKTIFVPTQFEETKAEILVADELEEIITNGRVRK